MDFDLTEAICSLDESGRNSVASGGVAAGAAAATEWKGRGERIRVRVREWLVYSD